MDTRTLDSYNPWWIDGSIPARFRGMVRREALPALHAGLSPTVATIVLGPRRVGKTVLLHQLVEALLADGVPAGNVVYVSADDPLLGNSASLIPDIVEYLARFRPLLGADEHGPSTPTYLLVDEVHAITDWPRLVKRYVDRGEPYVWVLTSSAGAVLHRGARESLAGRARDLALLPFSMAETAALYGSPAAPLLQAAGRVWEARGGLCLSGELSDKLNGLWVNARGLGPDLDQTVQRYLRWGGFPEFLTTEPGVPRTRYFLETVVERVLYQDVPMIAQVRNPFLMRQLLATLLSRGPGILNIARLASDFGVSHITVAEYLRIITVTMLAFVLDRYAATFAGRQRGAKKSVPVDSGLVAALSGWDLDGPNAAGYQGLLMEVAVHSWLRRRMTGHEILHWREGEKKEVDFVAVRPGEVVPIEVKWGPERRTHGLTGLDEFTRQFHPVYALVVTRDTFEIGEHEARLPLWMLG